ncbi:MAG: NADH:ubiquinone reductase (Na(+)-transporting) subunit C [Bacteroidales bacterium]|nr:NADH:ubiquinone reductase (Na(+)-transporting) subunit C [Bacteroidales bacterium]MDD4216712.1 NADH:ubiquinone reductase (Na(+)-transporting) subunit C [Bacteroidales bacterium]
MDRNSNKYTFIYAVIMVIVVATILTFVAVSLQPFQKKNVELEKKKNVLAAFNVESNPDNVESLYKEIIVEVFAINVEGEKLDNVDAFKINLKDELRKPPADQQWPIYVAKTQDGDLKYIFPLYGKGLWGPLWGYISFYEDLNHVFGVYFDHKSETPGLGAEISTAEFQKEFIDKSIFDENGNFVSIDLIKTDASDNNHAVDAVSGGTITSHGLRDMLKTCLSAYLKFIENNKK